MTDTGSLSFFLALNFDEDPEIEDYYSSEKVKI